MTGRLHRAVAAALAAAAVGLLGAGPAAAAPGPSPSPSVCPSPSPTPARPAPAPKPGASPDLCAEQAALRQAHDTLSANLAAAQAAAESLRQSLAANARQQDEVRQLIAQSDRQIADLDASIQRLDAQVAATQARIQLQRRRLVSIERALYRVPDSPVVAIMQAGSLRDALVEIGDIASAGVRAQQLRRALQADEARLRSEREEQRADRERQLSIRTQRQQQLDRLDQLRQEQEVTSAQLSEKIRQTQAALARLDVQSAQVSAQIAAMLQRQQQEIIAAAVQQAWEQTMAWLKANPLGSVPMSAGHSTRYRFVWPEPAAQISQPFGPSDLALEPAFAGYAHFHTGIDLVEPDLSPILAADDGYVAAVGSGTTGYGNYVVLAHAGGLLTLYGHLNQAAVKVGEAVIQGQPIGLEGSTGNSTGPHLHFELRAGGLPVDPTPYLPPGPSAERS